MSEIKTQLRAYLETTPEVTFGEILTAVALDAEDGVEMARPRPQRPSLYRGLLVAAGTAVAIVVAVAALLLVLRGGSVGVSDTPVTETTDAVIPPATSAVTGTVTIELDGVSGMEGYRLLAGVLSETADSPLVGGAFWTIIDSDLFSDSDPVHPPIDTSQDSDVSGDEDWGADDYFWDLTAQLEPGRYQIDLWANPGELSPYGSHIPASPIERTCTVDIEVTAGENTTVVITQIPPDVGPCVLADEPSP